MSKAEPNAPAPREAVPNVTGRPRMGTVKPSRRALLGAAAVLPIAAVPVLAEAPNPDAEMIRLCAEHVANLHALNDPAAELADDDPRWTAYERTRDMIDAAAPQTLAGMVAKARAAKAEALNLDGTESPEGSPAESWAWDLLNDLLQITGRGVA